AADAVMKPRRENGATLVSPMTSAVGSGSALMAALLCWLFWEAHSACKLVRTQITCLRDAGRLCWGRPAQRPKIGHKKQGRRRSIPSTTLPAPDIKIGSRHPVNFRMPGILTGMCEPVHKGGKKLREGEPQGGKYPVARPHGASARSGPSPK